MKCRLLGGLFLIFGMLCAVTNGRADAPAPGQVLWTYPSGYTNLADYAVSKDGRVYLGFAETTMVPALTEFGYYTITAVRTNQLIALTPEGDLDWQTSEAGQYLAIMSDGRIVSSYTHSRNAFVSYPNGGAFQGTYTTNNFYIFNPDGSLARPAASGGRVALTADNSIVAANLQSNPNFILGADVARIASADYSTVWQRPLDRHMGEPPVLGSDGSFYMTTWGPGEPARYPNGDPVPVPTTPPALYAFKSDGSPKWSLIDYDTGFRPPVIGWDTTVYTGSHRAITNRAPDWSVIDVVHEHKFLAIAPDGTIKWSLQKPDVFSFAAIGETNNIYVCTGTKLLALTPDGTQRWEYDAEAPLKLCPALAADKTAYVVTEPGKLLAVNTDTGSKIWEYDAGRPIYHAPVIGTNGNIYLLVDRSDIVVVAGSAEAALTPWPMERHDAQRTSRTTQASTKEVARDENGQVTMTLSVDPGVTYKVEVSDDLKTWTEIGSFTSSSAAQTFLDESSAGKSLRFYRLAVPTPSR
jgi:outer membrane protein assembly factor BamB